MKKKVFWGLVISVVFFGAYGYSSEKVKVGRSDNKSGLLDFIMGRSQPVEQQIGAEVNRSASEKKSERHLEESNPKIQEEKNKIQEEKPKTEEEHAVPLSDEIVEAPIIKEQKLEEVQVIKVNEEIKNDDVFFSSFQGIHSLNDLLKNIQLNVQSLVSGKMREDDRQKLLQKKNGIDENIKIFFNSFDEYEKVCAMEQILMEYNSVSEISAYFLSDISKSEINKIQNALFAGEMNNVREALKYVFETDADDNSQKLIKTFQEKMASYDLKEFSNNLLKEIQKIPQSLLEPAQHEKVAKILNEVSQSISGDFKTKCFTLKRIIDSYNEIKTIPFRLRQITPESTQQLMLKSIDEVFFAKMIDLLKLMEEEGYSASENTKYDAEVMAARNIKKSMFALFGGVSSSGEVIKGDIEIFRTSESLVEKQNALKNSVEQFDITVQLFKAAVNFLKSKGRQSRIQDLDSLVEIDEKNIDKIFEKIFAYKNTIQNENPEDGVAITDEKITTVPNGGEENQQPELQDSEELEEE